MIKPMLCHKDGWLTQVKRRPSPHYNERPKGALVSLIVLHFISLPAGCFKGEDVDDLFMGCLKTETNPDYASLKGLRVSSHFLIRRDGEIRQYGSVNDRAWHAGLSTFEGTPGCNDYSVGIELEGTGEVPFEGAQYTSLWRLLNALDTRLPIEAITGHEFIAPGRKADPGPYFDWARVKEWAKGRWRVVTTPQ